MKISFCSTAWLLLVVCSTSLAAEVVTQDLTLKKGQMLREPLVIGADGVTVEGNGAILQGPGEEGKTETFVGVGLLIEGRKGVAIRNLRIRGFEIGLKATDCSELLLEGCDLSDNFTDPEHGWGDGERNGGLILTGVHDSVVRKMVANRVWNGIDLFDCDDNQIHGNDFSHCSNVCLKLWHSSRNQIVDNNLSYGLRMKPGEVHARDSTSVLIESGSNDNRFERNDATHGGDGIFIRPLNAWLSVGNVFVENDCSYANNNGFESWSPGNTFLRNTANHCSYGFWLGYSDRTVLIGNEAGWNGLPEGKHNAPEPDFRHGGIVIVNGTGTHTLIQDNFCHDNNGGGIVFRGDLATRGKRWKMEHLVVQGNRLENNEWGIFARFVDQLFLAGNQFQGNEQDELLEEVTRLIRGDGLAGVPPEVEIQGPERVLVGETVRYSAKLKHRKEHAVQFAWVVDDQEISSAQVEHAFSKPGFERVSLTVTDGHLGGLAALDVYVIAPGDEVGTEGEAARWGSEIGREPRTGGTLTFTDDPLSIVGSSSVRMRPHQYAGAGVSGVFPGTRDAGWDLSAKRSVAFWLRFLNPNNGFQGPTIVRLRAGSRMLTYMPTRSGRPLNLLQEFPYPEARAGWQRVEVPLAGGDGWSRFEGSEGEVPAYVDGLLEFETISTPMETQDATSLASDGKVLYCASIEGDRVWRSEDGVRFEPLRSPRDDLRSRGSWINGMLAFTSRGGARGSLILRHLDPEKDRYGVEWSRLIRYDIAKERWSWLPTRLAAGHGSVTVGKQLFALAHAIAGNYGGPLARVDLDHPEEQAERSTFEGIQGESAGWLSRAAQLTEVGEKIYGIKNDWLTPRPDDESKVGDRLFTFDPKQFQASSFTEGEPWDAANWSARYTPVTDLGPLPFEVGHGAALVGLPPRWNGMIGKDGGLFIVAGCSPSNHEGQGPPSAKYALYDLESSTFHVGSLPDVTGTGTSAVFHQGKVYIKRGGLNFPLFNSHLWIVRPISAEQASRRLAEQEQRGMTLEKVDCLELQFDSVGYLPFEIWIDGLRFE
ncbi:MAG: right-handed parallel beta-helix repeat-containing protein [Planctomycetota bacterium]